MLSDEPPSYLGTILATHGRPIRMIEPDQASGTPFAYCKTYAMPYMTIRDIMYRVRFTRAR